jgi:hypothetical protein
MSREQVRVASVATVARVIQGHQPPGGLKAACSQNWIVLGEPDDLAALYCHA